MPISWQTISHKGHPTKCQVRRLIGTLIPAIPPFPYPITMATVHSSLPCLPKSSRIKWFQMKAKNPNRVSLYLLVVDISSEIHSSLPLQMALHYNVCFAPSLFVASIYCLIMKVSSSLLPRIQSSPVFLPLHHVSSDLGRCLHGLLYSGADPSPIGILW